MKELDVAKDFKEAKNGRNWLDQFLQCKIWEMVEGEEGDKSRIKSACQPRLASAKNHQGFNKN